MLRSVKSLEGYIVGASDGPIGHVQDFFFDDQSWVVRYLVVETGGWMKSRRVLISPVALRGPEWTARLLPVDITKEQVRNSPAVDTELPVSRQHEVQYADYYGYPSYWEGAKHGKVGSRKDPIAPGYDVIGSIQAKRAEQAALVARASGSKNDDPHLRSCRAVMRYLVRAKDGEVGEVNGMLLDDATWNIRYLVARATGGVVIRCSLRRAGSTM
jgi:PRC-barrel domain